MQVTRCLCNVTWDIVVNTLHYTVFFWGGGGQNYNYFKCNFTFVNLCKITRQKKASGAGKVITPSSGVILRTVLIPLH